MKYCKYCGSEMYDEALICMKCGCPASSPVTEVEVNRPKLNVLALLGFIFSLVGSFVSFLLLVAGSDSATGAFLLGLPFGIAGLVCSIIGLVKVKRKGQRGKGFAIAGLVVGAVICAIWLLILVIGFYYVFLIYLLIFLIFGAMA